MKIKFVHCLIIIGKSLGRQGCTLYIVQPKYTPPLSIVRIHFLFPLSPHNTTWLHNTPQLCFNLGAALPAQHCRLSEFLIDRPPANLPHLSQTEENTGKITQKVSYILHIYLIWTFKVNEKMILTDMDHFDSRKLNSQHNCGQLLGSTSTTLHRTWIQSVENARQCLKYGIRDACSTADIVDCPKWCPDMPYMMSSSGPQVDPMWSSCGPHVTSRYHIWYPRSTCFSKI